MMGYFPGEVDDEEEEVVEEEETPHFGHEKSSTMEIKIVLIRE